MRIAVLGAGGLGGFFGGLLARSGADVTLLARGAHLAALRSDGLMVQSAAVGDFSVPVRATDDPAQIGPVDLLLVGVKSYDLEAALATAAPLLGPQTVVLPLQNGIDAAEQVDAVLGSGRTLAGVAYVSALVAAPGVIRHHALNTILLGEPGAGPSPRAEQVAAVLRGAGIQCQTPPAIAVPLWEKFVMLAGTGGVMALTRLPAGSIREHPDLVALFQGAQAEAAAVGRAAGVPLADDLVARHWKVIEGLPPATCGSMLEGLRAGRRLELEALTGTVVRLGRRLGVPTPLNFAVYAGLLAYVAGPPTLPA